MDPKKAAKIFKALSNPNRLELYLKIRERRESQFDAGCECFLVDIMNSFNIGAPTVSHHIKELVNAGLIETEKRGKLLICQANEDIVAEAFRLLSRK